MGCTRRATLGPETGPGCCPSNPDRKLELSGIK
jgi:hypothetical protein